MHRADIIAAVRKMGSNLSALSRLHGFAPNTLRASISIRHTRAHRIIARAIGRRLHEIWPQFYGPDDQPLIPRKRRGPPLGAPARSGRPRTLTRTLTPLLITKKK